MDKIRKFNIGSVVLITGLIFLFGCGSNLGLLKKTLNTNPNVSLYYYGVTAGTFGKINAGIVYDFADPSRKFALQSQSGSLPVPAKFEGIVEPVREALAESWKIDKFKKITYNESGSVKDSLKVGVAVIGKYYMKERQINLSLGTYITIDDGKTGKGYTSFGGERIASVLIGPKESQKFLNLRASKKFDEAKKELSEIFAIDNATVESLKKATKAGMIKFLEKVKKAEVKK